MPMVFWSDFPLFGPIFSVPPFNPDASVIEEDRRLGWEKRVAEGGFGVGRGKGS